MKGKLMSWLTSVLRKEAVIRLTAFLVGLGVGSAAASEVSSVLVAALLKLFGL